MNETIEKDDNLLGFFKEFSINFLCLNLQLMSFKDYKLQSRSWHEPGDSTRTLLMYSIGKFWPQIGVK